MVSFMLILQPQKVIFDISCFAMDYFTWCWLDSVRRYPMARGPTAVHGNTL